MAAARATARTQRLVIATYPVNPPDPNPPIERESGYWRIYPYSMLDDLDPDRQDRTYLALVLENEFLRVTVLPELGGRLYSAFDKTAGREVFYKTGVIKPGLVALRGAWIAGGIEFNFPCSHNYVTFSPVDWDLCEAEDGTATAYIGAIEHVSRMRWTVGISLAPGRNQVFTDIRLENRTGLPHRYYFWSNSAERVTLGTRFISPLTSGYGWKGIMRYPVHEGEDISWHRHHPHALDLFSRHLKDDFFGCYDYDLEEGVVNVAEHLEVTGRKYFTWGHSGDGLVWRHILSDTDGPYIEIQSGPFPTQGIFKMLEPHRVHRWQETWYGVRQTGGFGFANRDVVLNLVEGPQGRQVTANATRELQATISASQDGKAVGCWSGALGPATPVSFALEEETTGRVEVVVTAAGEGEIARALLPWAGEPDELVDPGLAEGERDTVQGLVAQGYEMEKALETERARTFYERALARDPLAVPALVRLGILDLKAGLHASAEKRLTEALRLDMDAAEASLYRGQARRALGRREPARTDLWQAWHKSAQFGPVARYLLGEMAVEDGRLGEALEHFTQAAAVETAGTKSGCLRIAVLRVLGRLDEAETLAAQVAQSDPLNPLLRCEQGLIAQARGQQDPLAGFRTLARGDAQTYLEVALDYAGAGFRDTGVALLRMATDHADGAAVRYCLGWLLEQAGQAGAARAAFAAAQRAPEGEVFAHRLEEEAALRRAAAVDPADARAPYYLGTLLYMAGRTAEGRQWWQEAVARGSSESAVYRSIGWVAWRKDGDPRAAVDWYRQAVERRPDDYRLYIDLDQIRAALGDGARLRLDALLAAPALVRARGSIVARMAQFHADLGEYDQAIALLESRRFDPWEGATGLRLIYLDAHVGKGDQLLEAGDLAGARASFARALEYPISLGVGKSWRPSDAAVLYRAGLACQRAGDGAAARAYWQEALGETHHPVASQERVYVEMCRLALGQKAEAAAMLAVALAEAEKLQREKPAQVQPYLVGGLAAQALGQPERAGQAFATAARLAPGNLKIERLRDRLAAQ
ncbi:MAG: DUF5107 domain-containing protein [Candidatus Latescibacterota bacterium]